MIHYEDGTIALLTAHCKHVAAMPEGQVLGNSDVIGPWERFVFTTHDDAAVSLLSAHAKYVGAGNDGNLQCTRGAVGAGEKFNVIKLDAGFDGQWDKGVILGDRLTWTDGQVTQLTMKDAKLIELTWKGVSTSGELRGDRIFWSDGEVWIKQDFQGFDGTWS